MPITALTIENFKGIREPVRIEFRPITLLFGPNSSGKSTILQALQYAREILIRENVDARETLIGGSSVDLGGFAAFVHAHDLSRTIRFRFDIEVPESFARRHYVEENPEFNDHPESHLEHVMLINWLLPRVKTFWLEVGINWSSVLDSPMVTSYEVGINDKLFSRIEASKNGEEIVLCYLNYDHPIVFPGEEELDPSDKYVPTDFDLISDMLAGRLPSGINVLNKTTMPIRGHGSALPRRSIEFSDELQYREKKTSSWEYRRYEEESEALDNILYPLIVGPSELVEHHLSHMRYLGPLRKIPPRSYSPKRFSNDSLWSTGLAAWDLLHEAEDQFIEGLNTWLQKLKCGYGVQVNRYKELDLTGPIMSALKQGCFPNGEEMKKELESQRTITRLFLTEEGSGVAVLPQDIGVGISQLLPVVVAALDTKDGMVLVEQPELHVHPAIQVRLGDLFISQITDREICFFIETHSEHLLLRLLRRIREKNEGKLPDGVEALTPQQLGIYYLVNTDQGIRASELRVSEDGDSLGRWPDGFFEERLEELFS